MKRVALISFVAMLIACTPPAPSPLEAISPKPVILPTPEPRIGTLSVFAYACHVDGLNLRAELQFKNSSNKLATRVTGQVTFSSTRGQKLDQAFDTGPVQIVPDVRNVRGPNLLNVLHPLPKNWVLKSCQGVLEHVVYAD